MGTHTYISDCYTMADKLIIKEIVIQVNSVKLHFMIPYDDINSDAYNK